MLQTVPTPDAQEHVASLAAQSRWTLDGRLMRELVSSGVAVSIATGITNPIDTVKVRIQVADQSMGRLGMMDTFSSIVRNEGPSALFKGLSPALLRASVYGGLRLGLYTPIKGMLAAESDSSSLTLTQKIAAGCASGGLAAAITNPTELVKTRLQAPGTLYASPIAVVRDMVASQGILSLWRGTVPSAARAAALTASQVATYDVVKHALMDGAGLGTDDVVLHVATGAITGVVTTTVTSPIDVLKTQMFVNADAGLWGTVRRLAAEEGVGAFFKGWLANYCRLGPQTLITFVAAEQLRHMFGLAAL